MSFVELRDHCEYEILNEFPFTIRRKSDHYEIAESLNSHGYPRVSLNRRSYEKHILIAKQFIPNDDPIHKTEVHHKNKYRDDYHIQNLEWVSHSKNNLIKTGRRDIKYEYFDEIPDDAIVVELYETQTISHEFEFGRYYYYHDDETGDDIFYGKIDEQLYRRLHIHITKNGYRSVSMININNKSVTVSVNKFKRQHDLM